jgi:hypothetical protein
MRISSFRNRSRGWRRRCCRISRLARKRWKWYTRLCNGNSIFSRIMAAKVKGGINLAKFKAKPKVKKKGIHAKTKQSTSKSSKNYVKLSRGQG